MKSHDRFDALAGAVALGEATREERSMFVAHAESCAECREDLAFAERSPLVALAASREEEVWRPTLDRAILTRIRDRHSERSRFTVRALAWAAGVSMAVNLVFVTGFASQVSGYLTPAPANPPITTLGIRLPAQTFADLVPAKKAASPRVAFRTVAPAVHKRVRIPFRTVIARTPVAAVKRVSDALTQPDVLAGLLDNGSANARRQVAVETSLQSTSP